MNADEHRFASLDHHTLRQPRRIVKKPRNVNPVRVNLRASAVPSFLVFHRLCVLGFVTRDTSLGSQALDRREHAPGRLRLVKDIEMQPRDAGVDQSLGLSRGEIDPDSELALLVVALPLEVRDESPR